MSAHQVSPERDEIDRLALQRQAHAAGQPRQIAQLVNGGHCIRGAKAGGPQTFVQFPRVQLPAARSSLKYLDLPSQTREWCLQIMSERAQKHIPQSQGILSGLPRRFCISAGCTLLGFPPGQLPLHASKSAANDAISRIELCGTVLLLSPRATWRIAAANRSRGPRERFRRDQANQSREAEDDHQHGKRQLTPTPAGSEGGCRASLADNAPVRCGNRVNAGQGLASRRIRQFCWGHSTIAKIRERRFRVGCIQDQQAWTGANFEQYICTVRRFAGSLHDEQVCVIDRHDWRDPRVQLINRSRYDPEIPGGSTLLCDEHQRLSVYIDDGHLGTARALRPVEFRRPDKA